MGCNRPRSLLVTLMQAPARFGADRSMCPMPTQETITACLRSAGAACTAYALVLPVGRGTAQTPVSGGPVDPPLPIDLAVLDAAEHLRLCLVGWADQLAEQQAVQPPRSTSGAQVAEWLLQRAPAIVWSPWADTMLQELQPLVHQAAKRLGALPAKLPIPTPCECGAPQALSRDKSTPLVTCKNGHTSPLLDHVYDPQAPHFTVPQVARLLNCSTQTVRNKVQRGELTNMAEEGQPYRIPSAEIAHLALI